MLTLHISQADVETANFERISHPLSIIRKRFQVIWLLSQGFTREQAAKIAEVSRSSVKNYIKAYHSKGVEGLYVLKYKSLAEANLLNQSPG
jgi:predicted transcriptional regulator